MGRHEFHRRYLAMTGIKAELIRGVVHVASPVSYRTHGRPDQLVAALLVLYCAKTPGFESASNTTVILDRRNELQPDQIMFRPVERGGQVTVGQYLRGAPEFVAEIAYTSANIDLGAKKRTYFEAGVREYLVVRTYDETVDWFVRRGDRFASLPADADGILHSEAFPGLWLNVPALLTGDQAAMLATLEAGLASRPA
jgi:Uma2 family endonuclease